MNHMQTILGAGGAIGIELAKTLPIYTDKIRLVSRNPERVNEADEVFKADISKYEEVVKAVEGSEIVYRQLRAGGRGAARRDEPGRVLHGI